MLDFLFDNPYLLFLLVYALIRLLRGRKAPAEAPKAGANRAQATQRVNPAAVARGDGSNARSLENRLEELAREWERKLSGQNAEPAALTTIAAPAAVREATMVREAPAVREATMVREASAVTEVIVEPMAPEPTGSFDTNRVFEPSAATLESRRRAFEFKEAVEKSAQAQWHLGGFETSPAPAARVIAGAEVAVHPDDEPSAVAQLVADPDQLYRAIILSEVLGRPRALRPWRAAI